MTSRVRDNKWILYKHTNNWEMICALAADMKNRPTSSISEEEKRRLYEIMREMEFYRGRNPEEPLDSINHRINTLVYFMFGYKERGRFLFSPLGNLFLQNLDNRERLKKIFLTMLWAIQYEQPYFGTSTIFQLHPFRLIFKLLSDSRLNGFLHSYEIEYIVMRQETIDEEQYEHLIEEIIEARGWSDETIIERFMANEHLFVNAIYEWDYYVSKLLESAGILMREDGRELCKLSHPVNRPDTRATRRSLRLTRIRLNPELSEYCQRLLAEFPYDSPTLPLNDPERLGVDVIKEIYSFYPIVLLDELGIEEDVVSDLLRLPQLIKEYSLNPEGDTAYAFEDVLAEGFNMFCNVEARKIGGAGNTDVECLYLSESQRKKFAVDAKSTKNKLTALNSGRLAVHRAKIGGEYTIIVTPRYVPAVLTDIRTDPIVIILASTFSEYLYNCINEDVREIDYSIFDEIIVDNYGTDVSEKISLYTMTKYGIGSET